MFSSIGGFYCLAAFASGVAAAPASDLSAALAGFPSLTSLKSLVDQRPAVFDALLSSHPSVTVLAPDNDAFAKYSSTNGQPLSQAASADLNNILSYHILGAGLTSANFSAARGITIPTLLQGELYNNRSAGAELTQTFGADANGQVVYVQARQHEDAGFSLQAGGDADAAILMALDKTWPGGYLHIVNQVLDLPRNCSNTLEGESSLKTLSESLENTDVYDAIDYASNVTCLAPSNAAFEAAGNPQENLSRSELNSIMWSYALPQPLYPDHIRDGMELTSMGNTTIKITLKGNDTYFNDAKVVQSPLL
ncbi:FAS1 domain-containing protein [Parathielavia appendiculata]|uniref:FAS1 domain-containing protein n=1 Tax=Parathielavia appendiculata TaxID=2587402 RepID=A0AAN6YY34_9PEZI|nr:FAS1 domain-containing protein [Parathielavia appendiculata]